MLCSPRTAWSDARRACQATIPERGSKLARTEAERSLCRVGGRFLNTHRTVRSFHWLHDIGRGRQLGMRRYDRLSQLTVPVFVGQPERCSRWHTLFRPAR